MRIDETQFEEAEAALVDFLRNLNEPANIVWIFCEDVLRRPGDTFVHVKNPVENRALAHALYEKGRRNGLGLELSAACSFGSNSGCVVRLPTDRLDSEYKMMSPNYVKLSVVRPLPHWKAIGALGFRWRRLIGLGALEDMPSKFDR